MQLTANIIFMLFTVKRSCALVNLNIGSDGGRYQNARRNDAKKPWVYTFHSFDANLRGADRCLCRVCDLTVILDQTFFCLRWYFTVTYPESFRINRPILKVIGSNDSASVYVIMGLRLRAHSCGQCCHRPQVSYLGVSPMTGTFIRSHGYIFIN